MLKYSLAFLLLANVASAQADAPAAPATPPSAPATAAAPPPVAPSYHDELQRPTDAAGKLALAIFEQINHYDEKALRTLHQEQFSAALQKNMPFQKFQETILSEAKQTGGYAFYSQRHYQPVNPDTVLILRDRTWGNWGAIVVQTDEQGKIKDWWFGPARPGSDYVAPRLTQAQMLAQAGKLIKDACTKQIYSGTLLMAHGEQVLLKANCGEANKRYHVKNQLDTKFNLGSMNKMFTSVALAQLVEQGKLSWDDKLSQYLDESWLPKEMSDKITIHHLLSHSSGLGNYFNEQFVNSSRLLYRDVNDYKPLLKNEKLEFTPGERFSYSNSGMLLVGAIVEKVSGQNYFEYIREHIYRPANMRNSDSYDMDIPVENLAMGYAFAPLEPLQWRDTSFKHVVRGGPAGGGFSTVPDLHRFALALQSGKLIKPATLQRLWQENRDFGYGYGFQSQRIAGLKVVGHGGGFAGISADLSIWPGQGYIFSALSNQDAAAYRLTQALQQLVGQVAGKDGKVMAK
jgi:CubicO group peptidase (beta-lactamase class C family)